MKVLIIEDEEEISTLLRKGLEAESCVVDVAHDGDTGIKKAKINNYDVIILDLYIPKVNGIVVARTLREEHITTPILVLTSETNMRTKIEMLALCDDYVSKPFSFEEIVARLRALTRRGKGLQDEVLSVGPLSMDTKKFTVSRDGEGVHLRNREFALLEYFMRNPSVVLSREKILEHVWGTSADPFTNTVDVHVRMLRKKLNDGFETDLITTIPKRGYKLDI